MNNKSMVLKVGVFVLIGLILAAAMVMRFSKGTGFSTTYQLYLEAKNAAGIIPGAAVLMAGVPIGSVSEIRLAPDGSKVVMVASIYSRFKISKSAVFGIGTVGFLGDRYISVSPGQVLAEGAEHPGDRHDGDTVPVQEAFSFETVGESASDLMTRLSGSVGQLSNAVRRLDRTLLSETNLNNLTETVSNLKQVSARALATVGKVDSFLGANTNSLGQTVTNFATFSEKLNTLALELRQTLSTNSAELNAAMKNISSATERADRIVGEVEQGRGLVGKVLRSEDFSAYSGSLVSNLMIFSSNLNHKGLWGVFRKPRD